CKKKNKKGRFCCLRRKRSVSMASYGRDKRKDDRSSPPILKIITWNVRGLQSERLRKKKVLFLQKLDYDILCLQELRLKTKEDIEELIKLWGPSHSVVSIGEDSADGVGFFFKNTHVNIIKKRDIIPGRLLLVDCHYGGQKFRLINVYTAPERTKKMQLLKKMRHLLECGFNTVLCGDFNMVTEENDRIASTIFKESREGKLLTQICNDASLRDLYRILNPQTIHFTRFDSSSKTRIDRIYISSEIVALRYNDFSVKHKQNPWFRWASVRIL
uniref:exodeoxyribonuclease III n=1 Tax=Maylandia zebra TaxID=106582 RepID=A0A3P9B483_9CICH